MMKKLLNTLIKTLIPVLVLSVSLQVDAYEEGYLNPTQGWKIMQSEYDKNHPLDAISFEWDYWMIHSDTWNGIVGYVLANPRGKAPLLDWALLPNGNNVGVVGEIPGKKPVANYVNFGIDNSSINASIRMMKAQNNKGQFADYQAMPNGGPNGEDAFKLRGKTTDWEWDFLITQDMADRDYQRPLSNAFTTQYGKDVGLLKGEEWNVDMSWPRTNVVGWVKDLKTGQVILVNGKGYREDSWGKYLLSVDGWDFLVFGETDSKGVMGSFQTYHHSPTMDYFDLSFYDNGQLISKHFDANKNELAWKHADWRWDGEANSCVPESTTIKASKDGYTVELFSDIGDHQRPILANQTVGVSIFFIQEHFPTVKGTIKRADGTVVKTFTARAGGEFSRTKDVALWHSDFYCGVWGLTHHRRNM
jgi:hypothetical protein